MYINYGSLKILNHKAELIEDNLVIEAPLQISINEEAYTVVMRTPGNDIELIRGLLHAEDIYKNSQNFNYQIIKDENFNTIINVHIPKNELGKGYLNKRTLLSVSSCGICGKTSLDDIKVSGQKLNNIGNISLDNVHDMYRQMSEIQTLFKETGASHACAFFDTDKKLLTIKEDIGRHNAVDKCVGDLLINDELSKAKFLFVSGRVSYEILTKAFFSKITTIIAVSGCSSLAVDFAKEFGICLIGFSRKNKMTIYSSIKNITYEEQKD